MFRRYAISALTLVVFFCAQVALAQDAQRSIIPGAEVSQMLEADQPLRWVPGQVIVKFRTSTHDDNANLRRMGFTEHLRDTSGGAYIYSIPEPQITTLSAEEVRDQTVAAVEQMRLDADVEFAQLNYVMHISRTPNDPWFAQQWHYRNNGSGDDESPGGINLPDTWDRSTGSTASVIAVVDTGILPDHPDIAGSANLLPGFDMITDPFTGNDGDGRDPDATDPGDGTAAGECRFGSPAEPDSWHGTHVAGTIGVGRTDNHQGVAGINWSSRVVPMRALGRCGGSIADINDAIRWAAGLPVPNIATNPNPAKVINMSLGASAPCSASPSTQSAINDVVAAGVTVVVAAGNEASDAANSFPASCNNVITVAASDFNGELVTRYSNFGAVVDIMAPGGNVNADEDNDGNPDGVLSMVNGGYAFFNGTSMAAPHVAGVAGLLVAQDPTLTPADIEDLVKDNAIPRNSSQCPEACGAGLLNANISVGAPNPPAEIQLSVNPTDFNLDEGDSATLTTTVTQDGEATAGKTVSFAANDTQVATVSPAAAVTDNNGLARATVTAISKGNSSFTVSVQGASQTTPVTVAIRVAPGIGLIAMLALALLIAFFGFRRFRTAADIRE